MNRHTTEITKIIQVLTTLITIFTAAITTACQMLYPAEGEIVTKEIKVGNIKKLIINDIFDLYITPDTTNKMIIESGINQQKNIEIQYSPHTSQLTLSNTSTFRAKQGYRRIKINLHTSTITQIEQNEASGIYFTDTLHTTEFIYTNNSDMGNTDIMLDAQKVTIYNHNTNGIYQLKGKAQQIIIHNQGLSTVDASEMPAAEIECVQISLGNCYIRAMEKLRWSIYRNGNIYQNGQIDNIEGHSHGKGKLYVGK